MKFETLDLRIEYITKIEFRVELKESHISHLNSHILKHTI